MFGLKKIQACFIQNVGHHKRTTPVCVIFINKFPQLHINIRSTKFCAQLFLKIHSNCYFKTSCQHIKMNLGDQFPNFTANTTEGPIDFHEWIGDKWAILFSHPADYTPVCTTELGRAAQLVPEFEKRNVKLIALSCDSVESHNGWIKDIQAYSNLSGDFPFPIIDDESRELAVKLNMLDKDEIGQHGLPLTCRAVFIIDSKKKLRASILYPASSGRNFDEILRVIDSMQLTDRNKVATPVDWQKGSYCMVLPNISNDQLDNLYPKGVEIVKVPSAKTYIRKTPCPE